MKQHTEIGGSNPSLGSRRFLYCFLIRPFPKDKRREARPNEIGLSDFLYQGFQHENDMRKGKQSRNRTKKSAIGGSNAVGYDSSPHHNLSAEKWTQDGVGSSLREKPYPCWQLSYTLQTISALTYTSYRCRGCSWEVAQWQRTPLGTERLRVRVPFSQLETLDFTRFKALYKGYESAVTTGG